MKKILFLIHDLGPGGAEKVLVNLVNNMDRDKFDITVMAMFGGGVNEQFLKEHIRYRAVFSRTVRGNSHLMKLLSPKALHRWFIKEHYDVEISYLEGPSARVISGCTYPDTKLVSWIHVEQKTQKKAASSFRSVEEAMRCYNRFDRLICVSETVKEDFLSLLPIRVKTDVLYNTNESDAIIRQAAETVEPGLFRADEIKLAGVGKLRPTKGFDRLIRTVKQLRKDGFPVHLYLLGKGPEEAKLRALSADSGIGDAVSFLGYQTNPYKYVSRCDLFVCSSHAEGFSTAATEALIVGTPVITTEVSGMREMLGNDEYGVITANDEEALYLGIKRLLDNPALLAHYREKAAERGRDFSMENTVKAVEDMLLEL
jgi:glycosyltransferase involved in cell wall biosynthesis